MHLLTSSKKALANILLSGLLVLHFPFSSACDLNLKNGFGPWDYYDQNSHAPTGADPMGAVKRVTNVHLTPSMLALQKGGSSTIGGDLDYTLRAVPNHPDALNLASRFEKYIASGAARPGTKMSRGAGCYFERAIAFRPNEPTTRMIYGMHLHRSKKYSKAVSAYEAALTLGMNTPDLHYNMGLALYKAGRYEEATEQAKLAYGMGFPLPGLKNYLKGVGYWKD
jgi:tetratricopeptide (TPR) repeat protein